MAEALKTFREGEDILASETNENNQYLLSKLSDNAAQVQNYVESEVATIKSNVASVQATLQEGIDAVNDNLTSLNSSFYDKISLDYEKSIEVPYPVSSKTFTAPKYGVYIANIGINNARRSLYINGVVRFVYVDSAERTSFQTFYVPLCPGDVIYWSANATATQSVFYPYKGQ